MCQLLRYILVAVAALSSLSAAAISAERKAEIRDSLERALPALTSAAEHISALYNIFDLSPDDSTRTEALRRLYDVANEYDVPDVQLDVLTHLANIKRNNMEALMIINRELDTFVATDRQREAKLFVGMSLSDLHAKEEHEEGFSEYVSEIFRRESDHPSADGYDRALMLYNLCNHLAKTTSGELLEQYTERLEHEVEALPLPSGSVRNLIYTRAAPVFTNNQNYRKAVEIDKKMVNIIDSLSDSYHHNGRPYRDLNIARFICYRRLLGNFKGLRPVEVDALYDKICRMAEEDPNIAADMHEKERSKIFYYLAKERYAEVIPAIKRQLDKPANKAYRFYYLNALVESAEKIGDKATQLEGALELNKLLRAEIERRASERYRELEILYDVNTLREARAAAVTAHETSRARLSRVVSAALILVVLLLLALITLLWRNNRKIKKLANRKSALTKKLLNERNELRQAQQELIAARNHAKEADKLKGDFINNVSHEIKTPMSVIVEYTKLIVDCVPDDKNHYLHRFANVVEQNAGLITTLLNDILDVSSLEHDNISINPHPATIYDICNYALDTVFENPEVSSRGAEVVFNKAERPDRVVVTDPQRVGQVLVNLLANAQKFTEKGYIDLEFDYDKDSGTLTFTVADTGIGVPSSQSEKIFDRFSKLDSTASGCGLGLYISRLITNLLGGTLRLDTDYRGGAKFIFSIPVK